MAVARYNSNGSLSNAFSGDGKQITGFSGLDSYAYGVVVQTDGKIILAGQAGELFFGNTSIALVRYNTNGSLDNTFSGDGKVTTYFFDSTTVATAIALQPDGKIVAGGYAYNPKTKNEDFILARYTTNGTLDNSFNKDGKVATDFFGRYDDVTSITIEPDGKIVASGEAYNSGAENFDYAAARYDSDGSLDKKFGRKGLITGHFESSDSRIFAVTVQPDGKVVVAGDAHVGKTSADFALARFNADGSPDKSFGDNGTVTTDFFGDDDMAVTLVVQPDGKIVAAGQAYNTNINVNEFALARYNADGSPDKKFGRKGTMTTDFFGNNTAEAIALQPDGKIVVAGYTRNNATDNTDFALARYTTNGLPDNTFNGDGKLTTDFGFTEDFANSVAIQSDGKIVATGSTFTQTSSNFALVRYNANGSPDHSFDGDGKVVTAFNSDVYGAAMAIQPDGKIVVGGDYYIFSEDNYDFALARYNTDGSPDKSFDSDGKQVTDFSGGDVSATALGLQQDGKIVIAGYSYNNATGVSDVQLTRYNSNGLPDKSFDEDGTLITHLFGYDNYVTSLYIKGNKAYVGAYTITPAQIGVVAAYLLGPATFTAAQVSSQSSKVSLLAEKSVPANDLIIKAYPNPSTQYFMLSIHGVGNSTVVVRVRDASGQLVEAKTNVAPNTTLRLGRSYRPGTYYAEIIQGNKKTVVKLVKQ